MVGMLVCCVFASKKHLEQEFFIPVRMYLALNSLTAMEGHDCPFFCKLLWCLVTLMIFVSC